MLKLRPTQPMGSPYAPQRQPWGPSQPSEFRLPLPERVARLVYSVMQKRHPRLRYTVGPVMQRAAVWLKRLMPYAVVEKAMRLYYD